MANSLREISGSSSFKNEDNGDILCQYYNDENNKNIIGLISNGKLSLLLEEIFSMSKNIIGNDPSIPNINIRNKDMLSNFIANSGLYSFIINGDQFFYAKYIGYKVSKNKKEKEYLYFYEKDPSTTRNFINNDFIGISGREILRLNLKTQSIDRVYFKSSDNDEIIDTTSSIRFVRTKECISYDFRIFRIS